jgi:hypothetical protein
MASELINPFTIQGIKNKNQRVERKGVDTGKNNPPTVVMIGARLGFGGGGDG